MGELKESQNFSRLGGEESKSQLLILVPSDILFSSRQAKLVARRLKVILAKKIEGLFCGLLVYYMYEIG